MLHLTRASRRNTECYELRLGEHVFGFSYRTIVTYRGPCGNCYRHNEWGRTTGRHLTELGRYGEEVDEATMDERVEQALIETGLELWADKMGVKNPEEVVATSLAAVTPSSNKATRSSSSTCAG